jgi:GNAT superfamily N-acetyltransferase
MLDCGAMTEPPPPVLAIRRAVAADLAAIVDLLADDAITRARIGYSPIVSPTVRAAFDEIAGDPDCDLVVGEVDGEIVATLQLTVLRGLARSGRRVALVESVRVRSGRRGQRLGDQLMRWAIARAVERGCRTIQLTTDKRRHDAHRFYERLGFVASHEGMKLDMDA